MQAYQFEVEVPANRKITIERPPEVPVGVIVQILVLFPDKQSQTQENKSDLEA